MPRPRASVSIEVCDDAMISVVRQTIERHNLFEPGGKVVVAVSGGADSLCLLHVLCALRADYNIRLHVAHLNHCLRGAESAADSAFVWEIAAAWGLPLTRSSVNVRALAQREHGSVEEIARRERYRFLASVAVEVGAKCIALGHNADDQTETVLMHWLRGSGLAGLRGMRPKSPLGALRLGPDAPTPPDLYLIRPLLYVPRADIEAYCRENGLQPRFDRSNLDTTYFRNRIRHELIPYLESYNPNIRELIRRSAEVIAGDYDIVRREVERAWTTVVRLESEKWVILHLVEWQSLPIGLQRCTLRLAVQKLRRHVRDIGWEHIENAVWTARQGQTAAQATLPDGLMLTVGYDELVIGPAGASPDDSPPFPWLDGGVIEVAVPGETPLGRSGWRVIAAWLDATPEQLEDIQRNTDCNQAFLDADTLGRLVFRSRQPGDRFQPLGMGGQSKSLHEFMINQKVPARWRDLVPILTSDGRIAWVAGWRMDERFRVTPQTRRILHLRLARAK